MPHKRNGTPRNGLCAPVSEFCAIPGSRIEFTDFRLAQNGGEFVFPTLDAHKKKRAPESALLSLQNHTKPKLAKPVRALPYRTRPHLDFHFLTFSSPFTIRKSFKAPSGIA